MSHLGLLPSPSTGPVPHGSAHLQEKSPRDKAAVPVFNPVRSQVSRMPKLVGMSVVVSPSFHVPCPSLGSHSSSQEPFRWHSPSAFTLSQNITKCVASFKELILITCHCLISLFRRHVQISRHGSEGWSEAPGFRKCSTHLMLSN